MRVWRQLKDLDSLAAKIDEGAAKQIDYDMQRLSPDKSARPIWDNESTPEDERPELFSFAVMRRLEIEPEAHLELVRLTDTAARLVALEEYISAGISYLAAKSSVDSVFN